MEDLERQTGKIPAEINRLSLPCGAAGLGVAYVMTENLDHLPILLQRWLRKIFRIGRVGHQSALQQAHVPLSKLMACTRAPFPPCLPRPQTQLPMHICRHIALFPAYIHKGSGVAGLIQLLMTAGCSFWQGQAAA